MATAKSALTIVFMDTGKAAPLLAREPSAQYLQQAAGLADAEAMKTARKEARDRFRLTLGQRCKAARGPMEISVAAERLGVHRNTIWNIERGDSIPDAFELALLAELYDVSAHYLLTGQTGAEDATEGFGKGTRAMQINDFVYVPHFDISASAGEGNLFDQVELVMAMRPFDQAYIRGELGINHDEIALLNVVGNSMEPMLHSRDTVMVDRRAGHEMFSDGIHVIRLDGDLLIKQVQRLPGKVFKIRSRNPDYETFEVKGSEETERDFAIIGRVRWAGVTIK
ncbi:MAG TPA: S24 family peptidase [Ramlibacter sp.]|nr:S24 family peptidase [Ramlibacter sp.]